MHELGCTSKTQCVIVCVNMRIVLCGVHVSALVGRTGHGKTLCSHSCSCTAAIAEDNPTGLFAGPYDPNDPNGPAPQPPSAWQHMLHVVGGVMHFFGRLSFLVDENAHAVHFFVSALLQLLDR